MEGVQLEAPWNIEELFFDLWLLDLDIYELNDA